MSKTSLGFISVAETENLDLVTPAMFARNQKFDTDSHGLVFEKQVGCIGECGRYVPFVLDMNGREIAEVNAVSSLDPKLRTAGDKSYLVRTFDLVAGVSVHQHSLSK